MARRTGFNLALAVALTLLALLIAAPAAGAGGPTDPLDFHKAYFDLGLDGAQSPVVSADGQFVYVAGRYDPAVSAFSLDGVTGRLAFAQAVRYGDADTDGLCMPSALALSPDSKFLYVAGECDHSIAVFARVGANCVLSYTGVVKSPTPGWRQPNGLALSPDGAHLYVSSQNDNAVGAFSRDATTGALTYIGVVQDGVDGADGLAYASAVAVSPDGGHVYVAGYEDHAIAILKRNAGTGALTYVDKATESVTVPLHCPNALAFSPDGGYLYATAFGSESVVAFSVDDTTGALTVVDSARTLDGVDGLDGANDVAVSPDGAHLYVAGRLDDALVTFSRDAISGTLTCVETRRNGGPEGVEGLARVQGVAVSPDPGEYVYAASDWGRALVAFRRDTTSGALHFMQARTSTPDLEGPVGAAVSPDGANVYVAAHDENVLLALARDRTSGGLTYLEGYHSDGDLQRLRQVRDVAVSPDGANVYAIGYLDDSVVSFARDVPTGTLVCLGVLRNGGAVAGLDGPQSLTVSPDGNYVYVASQGGGVEPDPGTDGVAIFSRTPPSGTLAFVDAVTWAELGCTSALSGSYAVAISPDGLNAYVAGYEGSSLTAFARDPSTGGLDLLEVYGDPETSGGTGLLGASDVVVSPDGRHVYVAGRKDRAIAIGAREMPTGTLTYVGTVTVTVGGFNVLDGVRALAMSPDGRQLYAASQRAHTLAVFRRDPSSGMLAYLGMHRDGYAGVDGLKTANGLAVSSDGMHVYVTGYDDDAVALFRHTPVSLPLIWRP